MFIETFDKTYYLPLIQPVYNYSQTLVRTVDLSNRCSLISELMSATFAERHLLDRIKSYHLICQRSSPHLQCFHDDVHLCLCYDHGKKRLANCFK